MKDVLQRRCEVERVIREMDCRLEVFKRMRSKLGVEDEELSKAIRSVEAERRGLVRLYEAMDEDTALIY